MENIDKNLDDFADLAEKYAEYEDDEDEIEMQASDVFGDEIGHIWEEMTLEGSLQNDIWNALREDAGFWQSVEATIKKWPRNAIEKKCIDTFKRLYNCDFANFADLPANEKDKAYQKEANELVMQTCIYLQAISDLTFADENEASN